MPYLVSTFAVFAVALLGLMLYRNSLVSHEDDSIHLTDREAGMISQQVNFSHKVEVLDRWVVVLTVLVVISGLLLFGYWAYMTWMSGYSMVG